MTLTIPPAAVVPPEATRWEFFRGRLEERRALCVQQRKLDVAEVATSVPDAVAMGRAADLLLTIEEIDAALERIADGTFGLCAHCGVDIPIQRLDIRPFATRCVACQDSAR